MDYKNFISDIYANINSGENEIVDDYNMTLDSDVAKNKMKKSNINVNLVVPDTKVNDISSQAQGQIQQQAIGQVSCAPKKVTIPIYKKENIYKKAVQIRELKVKCGTKDVQVGEKTICVNDDGNEVSCEPTVEKQVKYVPVESQNAYHKVIGGKPPCKIVLPGCDSDVPKGPKGPALDANKYQGRPKKGMKGINETSGTKGMNGTRRTKSVTRRCRSIQWACEKSNIKMGKRRRHNGRGASKVLLTRKEVEIIRALLKEQYEKDYGDLIWEEFVKAYDGRFDDEDYVAFLESEFKEAFLHQLEKEISDDFDVDEYKKQLEDELREGFRDEIIDDFKDQYKDTLYEFDGEVIMLDGKPIGQLEKDEEGNYIGFKFN